MFNFGFSPIQIFGLIVVLALVIAAGIWSYKYFTRHASYKDIFVPMPQNLRHDLFYGSYMCFQNQVNEVKDFVNLHWECFNEGLDKGFQNIREMQRFTVVDISGVIFQPYKANKPHMVLYDDYRQRLDAFIQQMREENLLHLVKVIVVIDEPNLNTTRSDFEQATLFVKDYVKTVPELAGVKMGVIYQGGVDTGYWAFEQYDIVGFDDYRRQSNIFSKDGEYNRMKAMLLGDQKIWLLPGGAKADGVPEQDPAAFEAVAHRDPEVFGIIMFLWADVGYEGIVGIRSIPKQQDLYTNLGLRILNLNTQV